jgi:hypothetical protein
MVIPGHIGLGGPGHDGPLATAMELLAMAKRGRRYGQGHDVKNDGDRKRAFGLRDKDKWPDEGMPSRIINGIEHMITPKDAKLDGLNRRAIALCPDCRGWFCAGHIGQHRAMHRFQEGQG